MLRMLRREYHYVIHNHSTAGREGNNKSPEACFERVKNNERKTTKVPYLQANRARGVVDETDS